MSSPVSRRNQPRRGEPEGADVHDRGRAGADDAAGGGDADELAALQGLDRVAEDLGVAEAVLVAEHDDRLAPGGVDPPVLGIARAAAARDGDGVGRLGQDGQQVVGRRAAAVFAHVDDQAILAGAGRVELLLELVEARRGSSPGCAGSRAFRCDAASTALRLSLTHLS